MGLARADKDNIVMAIYTDGKIPAPEFGFWCGSVDSPVATLTLGGYDTAVIEDGNNDDGKGLFWFDDTHVNNDFWEVDIVNLTFGGVTDITIGSGYIFNDKFLELPEPVFDRFFYDFFS